jgi:hypothetical protein
MLISDLVIRSEYYTTEPAVISFIIGKDLSSLKAMVLIAYNAKSDEALPFVNPVLHPFTRLYS